jgi:hypothetical protein
MGPIIIAGVVIVVILLGIFAMDAVERREGMQR